MNKQVRNSNIELLRIICMVMIVFYHYVQKGGTLNMQPCFNRTFSYFILPLGNIAVNTFVIISGYFFIKPTVKKGIFFLLKVFFYSFGIALFFVLLGFESFENIGIESFLPILFNKYWFATAYFEVFLVSPLLNRIVNKLTKIQFIVVLGLLFVSTSSIYMITRKAFLYSSFSWFCVLYLIGAFIKKFENDFVKGVKSPIIVAFIAYSLVSVGLILFGRNYIGENYVYWISEIIAVNMPWTLTAATALFFVFKNISIRDSKTTNLIASAAFGVYLFHDNELMQKYLYTVFLSVDKILYSEWFIPTMVINCLVIYCVATVVDLIRAYFLEKPLNSFVQKIADSPKNKPKNGDI